MVPFIIAAVLFAIRGRYDTHARITRWLWPVWMYVSISGVTIYLMLYVR
jgi:putative membrane protein